MSAFKTWLAGLTSKATPADADAFHITDSAASGASKRVTLTNLWANYIKSKADALYAAASDLTSHTSNTSNPHSVTATQVGLGSVTNDAQTKAAIVPNTAPSAGQLPVGNAGGTAYAPVAVSGDATLASTGALTVANDAITYAKMQDVSATSRVLGRATSGAGDTEELTLSQVLDMVGSAAQGDILYRGVSGWTRLGAGTSGQVLQTGGAGANPSWATSSGGSPAGSAGQVQYTTGSAFAAAPLWVSANTVEQYDGANGQSYFLYNNRTSGSNYERGGLWWSSNNLRIGTAAAGTGTARSVQFLAGAGTRPLTLTDGALSWDFNGIAAVENTAGNIHIKSSSGGDHNVVLNCGGQGQLYLGYASGTATTSFLGATTANLTFGISQQLNTAAVRTLTMAGQSAWASATTYVAGGDVVVSGGAGASGFAGDAHGGHVKLAGGTAYGTGTKGRVILDAPNAAPQDSFLSNGEITLYLDQSANKLMARVKYSDGTLKSGEVALT